jgi:glyoxylase-like metal-dependent hydrolase (beta-lactamase superfamily II)
MFGPILIEVENAGPMTGPGNNTYLVADEAEGQTARLAGLIDAGIGGDAHLSALTRRLAERRARLTDVLVTHIHADHASGAPAIRTAWPGVRFAKYPWPDQDRQYAVDWRALADDEVIRIGGTALTVVHTPATHQTTSPSGTKRAGRRSPAIS